MKTHNARWHQNSPASWILKAPIKHGGAVLATVRAGEWRHTWRIPGVARGVALSCEEAQRAVRRALREEGT